MVINAPKLDIRKLITNDEVELFSKTHFRLIGRKDHVINSGGVKLHPEQIERKLSENLTFHFFIDKIAFKSKKEKLTIVIEDNSNRTSDKLTALTLLGKTIGMYSDKIELENTSEHSVEQLEEQLEKKLSELFNSRAS